MPTVVNTDTSAARNSTSSISRSRMMRARRRARRSLRDSRHASVVVGPGTADMKDGSADSIETKTRPGKQFRGRAWRCQQASLELRFALQQLVDRDADLGHAAEHRALLALLHVLPARSCRPTSGSGTYFTSFASFAPFFM